MHLCVCSDIIELVLVVGQQVVCQAHTCSQALPNPCQLQTQVVYKDQCSWRGRNEFPRMRTPITTRLDTNHNNHKTQTTTTQFNKSVETRPSQHIESRLWGNKREPELFLDARPPQPQCSGQLTTEVYNFLYHSKFVVQLVEPLRICVGLATPT